MEKVQEKLDKIDKTLSVLPYVGDAVKATGMKPFYLLLAFLFGCAFLVAIGFPGSTFIVQIIGVTFPCCCSLLALGTEETLEDDKKWLTYWIVFSIFNLIDHNFAWFTALIPFYLLIKLFILIWLQNPMTEGALSTYKRYVRPFAKKYGDVIETFYQEYIKPLENGGSSSDKKDAGVKVTKIADPSSDKAK